MLDDFTLLSDFARKGSPTAFTELVRRHLDFVYTDLPSICAVIKPLDSNQRSALGGSPPERYHGPSPGLALTVIAAMFLVWLATPRPWFNARLISHEISSWESPWRAAAVIMRRC